MKNHLLNPSDCSSNVSNAKEQPPVFVFKSIRLNPGITQTNFVCSLLFSVISAFGMGGTAGLQLLILLDPSYYNVSQDNAGSINSMILIIQSLVGMATGIPYGHLVDTIGRKMLVVIGSFSFLAGCLLLPLQTSVFPGFVLAFILITNGSAAFSSLPLMADYVAEESRGKAFAIAGVILSFAILIPNLLVKGLLYADVSLGVCYYIFGIITFVGLLINNFGLRKGTYRLEKPEDAQKTSQHSQQSFLDRMKEAYQIFKNNNWLKISLVIQALAASDFMILMSFLALYVKSLYPGEASATEGNTAVNNLQTLITLTMLVSMPFFGYILDKKNIFLQLCLLSLGGGITSLILFSLTTQPSSFTLYLGAFVFDSTLPGLGTILNLITFKHYPAEKRGIMVGFAQLVTNCSYFILAIGGGVLYDHWRTGPFVVSAGLLAFTIVIILILFKRIPPESSHVSEKVEVDLEVLDSGKSGRYKQLH